MEIILGVAGGSVRTGNSNDDTKGTAGCEDIGALKNGTLPGTRDCKGGTGPGEIFGAAGWWMLVDWK